MSDEGIKWKGNDRVSSDFIESERTEAGRRILQGWTDAINGVSWSPAELASKSEEYTCAFSAGRAWLESMTTKGEER